jgi:hypothetical protein
MKATPQEEAVQPLVAHFQHLQDPRRIERGARLLGEILVIAILAIRCGAKDSAFRAKCRPASGAER